MNVRELIETLEEFAESHGDETEVRLATQPNWPFENTIASVVAIGEVEKSLAADVWDGVDDYCEEYIQGCAILYIGEGRQIGYLPGRAKQKFEW